MKRKSVRQKIPRQRGWSNVNWDLPDLIIEQIHGISDYQIGLERRRRRHPARWDARSNPYGQKELLEAILKELVRKKLQSSPPPAVERLMHRINNPVKQRRSLDRRARAARLRRKQRWATVDWTRRDYEIAPLLGCTRERVRQMRITLGKPSSRLLQLEMSVEARARRAARVVKAVRGTPADTVLTADSLARQLGICRNTIYEICKEEGLDLRRFRKRLSGYNYQEWNWDLPNPVLKRTHGVAATTVVRARAKYGYHAKWDGRVVDESCPEFAEACRKERLKASRNAKAMARAGNVPDSGAV